MTIEPESIGLCLIDPGLEWRVMMKRSGDRIALETKGMGQKHLSIREAEHLRRALGRFIREAKEVSEHGGTLKPVAADREVA